ncbi:MAG: dihydrofolate reductase family protein [Ginsengibacter sp.]
MRKIIGAINMTLDGFCDHTSIIADDEIHNHYRELLGTADAILFGRITFGLMQYWQTVLENPIGNKSMDEYATAIDKIPKIVFSHTLNNVEWESAMLAKRSLKEEVLALRQSGDGDGKDILVGSRSLIISLLKLNLIDEFQLCVHPVIARHGLPLFENINDEKIFKLIKTKTFGGGAVILYYEPSKS